MGAVAASPAFSSNVHSARMGDQMKSPYALVFTASDRAVACCLRFLLGLEFEPLEHNRTHRQVKSKLQGAGTSFPKPLYMKWFEAYGEAHPQVQVDYQSIGSGAGVKSVIDKTVDFGAG